MKGLTWFLRILAVLFAADILLLGPETSRPFWQVVLAAVATLIIVGGLLPWLAQKIYRAATQPKGAEGQLTRIFLLIAGPLASGWFAILIANQFSLPSPWWLAPVVAGVVFILMFVVYYGKPPRR